jgi:hypothetical protein
MKQQMIGTTDDCSGIRDRRSEPSERLKFRSAVDRGRKSSL